jgi:hypothetical protein
MGGGVSKYHEKVGRSDDIKSSELVRTVADWPTNNEIEKSFAKEVAGPTNVDCWEFDIWEFKSPSDLIFIVTSIFSRYDFHVKFHVKFDAWSALMQKIRQYMGAYINPYHNFTHLVDVTQTAHCFLQEFGAAKFLEDIDMYSLILSCLVHDLEHPGTNNLYQINAETLLAIRYNDISVLENHHCALAFAIFGQQDSNIFAPLTLTQRKRIRKTMIELILSTDMSFHFALNGELGECVNRNFPEVKEPAATEVTLFAEKDRVIFLRSLLHAADISNPCKPWHVGKKWSDLVVEEFFAQGDREKKEGLPVTMNMDRSTTSQDEISLNFNDFIVGPFFIMLMRALPKLSKVCRMLEQNRNEWDAILRQRVTKTVPANMEEILDKWTTKKHDFNAKLKSALDEAERKNPISSPS